MSIDAKAPLTSTDPDALARRLEDIRERTLALVGVLPWETLRKQHIPILSPMTWDLGHIGNFEEMWLCERLGGLPSIEESYQKMFDAVLNPRPTRAGLPLPDGSRLYGYLADVREQSLMVAEALEAAAEPALAEGGFLFELVAEHEEQHQETLLQAMQVLEDPPYVPGQRRPTPPGVGVPADGVLIPAGSFLMGAGAKGFAYDNEKGRHEVELPAFRIDRLPVSDADFVAFVEDGGYRREELWSEAGWAWKEEAGLEAPGNWTRRPDDNGALRWHARFMNRLLPIPLNKPVVHICYYEAEAYARYAGKRLPTEAEWEKAALWNPEREVARRYPWGDELPTPAHANLDQLTFEPAERGAYPLGASAYGVHQMVGDVWEWTSSDFTAYPGFEAYPYEEYSSIFFGSEYKVLRGGSWATRPAVARGTFRNWDYPIRRQIFAGIRCAEDA